MLVSLRVGVLVLLLTPSFLWLFGGDPAICSVVAEQIMATPHDKLHFVYNKFKSAIAYELIQVSYLFSPCGCVCDLSVVLGAHISVMVLRKCQLTGGHVFLGPVAKLWQYEFVRLQLRRP
jgi:hypothetical protein